MTRALYWLAAFALMLGIVWGLGTILDARLAPTSGWRDAAPALGAIIGAGLGIVAGVVDFDRWGRAPREDLDPGLDEEDLP